MIKIYENIHNLKDKINNLKDLKKFSKEIKFREEITLFHATLLKKFDKYQKN